MSASIRTFVEAANTTILLSIHNTLSSSSPVKKFMNREEAITKTVSVLEENGYKTLDDRDRLLADLKLAGVHVLPESKQEEKAPTKAKATRAKKEAKPKAPRAKKEAKAAPPPAEEKAPQPPEAVKPPPSKLGGTPLPVIPEGTPEEVAHIMRTTELPLDGKLGTTGWRRLTVEEATELLQRQKAKEAEKALSSAPASSDISSKEEKAPRMAKTDATTLGHIRDLIKASGADRECHSDDLAKSLGVNMELTLTYAKRLQERGYITMEDDSANPGEPLYILKLTDLGRSTPATKKGRVPSDQPGPRSKFTGKRIFKTRKDNPRREGTHGWKSWEALKDGMTFEQYRAAGGRNNDLQWDLDRNWVELRDA